jgi:hypothetical protein
MGKNRIRIGVEECPGCKIDVAVEVEHHEDPPEAASFIKHWPPDKNSEKDKPCRYSYLVVSTLE